MNSRNPFDISEQATIECARAQLEALEACLLEIDTRTLCFDPDFEYREEVKLRLVVDNTAEEAA